MSISDTDTKKSVTGISKQPETQPIKGTKKEGRTDEDMETMETSKHVKGRPEAGVC